MEPPSWVVGGHMLRHYNDAPPPRDLDSPPGYPFRGRITQHANDRSGPMPAVTGDSTVRGAIYEAESPSRAAWARTNMTRIYSGREESLYMRNNALVLTLATVTSLLAQSSSSFRV